MRDLIDYLGGLTVTQGRRAGQPFEVLPWQRRFVRGAFRPATQSAALSIARGNGKTTLLAGIAAATLDGPLMVPRGETVIVAASFNQARIAFDHVRAFMGDKLGDRNAWRVWDTAQQASIESRTTGARVRVIGSDPRRAHGLAPVLVLADEPAQWPDSTGERMVSALMTATGKQPHSRFVALGTKPASPDHWFTKMLAGAADHVQTHKAGDADSRFSKRTWRKANPSLAAMPDLEAAIRIEAGHARRDPALLPRVRGVAAEPRHGGHRTGDAPGCRNVASDRGRRGAGGPGCVGPRPGDVQQHVGDSRLLDRDRPPGGPGRVPA